MLNTTRLRHCVLGSRRARFRRSLGNPVTAFAVQVIIVSMILLLNVDVAGVGDLLTGTLFSATGVCGVSRWVRIPWLIACCRSLFFGCIHHLDLSACELCIVWMLAWVRRVQAAVVPWAFWPPRYHLLFGGPPGRYTFLWVTKGSRLNGKRSSDAILQTSPG